MNNTFFESFNSKANNYAESWPQFGENYFNLIKSLTENRNYKTAIDVACGTGLHTKTIAPLFEYVVASEPNSEMRAICKKYLSNYCNISFNSDCAENIQSEIKFDIIFVAQAFTLLDKELIKISFRSILNQGGSVVLAWNNKTNYVLFNEIAALSKNFCPLYSSSNVYKFDYKRHSLDDFFTKPPKYFKIKNDVDSQISEEIFLKRCLSTSYAPTQEMPNYIKYYEGLKMIFEKYSNGGLIYYPLETTVYIGEIL